MPIEPLVPSKPAQPVIRRVTLYVMDRLITAANSFGLWQDYRRRPSYDSDGTLTIEDLSNSSQAASINHVSTAMESDRPPYWPFANISIWRTMSWLNNGQVAKSEAQTTAFVQDVILQPDFDPIHLAGFDTHQENLKFKKAMSASQLKELFTKSSVDIMVPSGSDNVKSQLFSVPGLLHRSITAVISEAFNDPLAHLMHLSPFRLYQQNPKTGDTERVYSKLYMLDVFLAEHENIQKYGKLPPEDPECKHEKVVAALMVALDATQLTDFGSASGWPIYLMLGNLSIYI